MLLWRSSQGGWNWQNV